MKLFLALLVFFLLLLFGSRYWNTHHEFVRGMTACYSEFNARLENFGTPVQKPYLSTENYCSEREKIFQEAGSCFSKLGEPEMEGQLLTVTQRLGRIISGMRQSFASAVNNHNTAFCPSESAIVVENRFNF